MVKINIISGFLGAGKTTLIKKLLGSEAMKGEKIILLENEYGDVGVDGSFLKDSGIIVDELNSGCICCTLVGDFQKAVDELIEKYNPDRLIIEPSGVGKLSEIVNAVEKCKAAHPEMEISGCATIVDAGKCRMHMKNFGEFFLDQVKTADTVIFSRTQNLTADRVEKSRVLIAEAHEGVRVITTPWDDLSADVMLEVVESGRPIVLHVEHEHHHHDHDEHCTCGCHDHEHEHHHDHDEHCTCGCHDHDHHHHHADEVFTSWGVETAKKFEKCAIEAALKELDTGKYGMVLRAKGILMAADGTWIHFDYVPEEYNVRSGCADITGKLCVIGSKLDEHGIQHLFGL